MADPTLPVTPATPAPISIPQATPPTTSTAAPNSLLATIQKNSASLAGAQAPMTDTTQQASQLLAAKSGLASAAGQGTMSNLGEQGAVAQTQAQLGAQAPSINAQMQQSDITAQKQALDTQNTQAQIAQSSKFDTAQNQIKVQALMQGLSQDKGQLDMQKDQDRLEQTAFLLSMQDKKYTNSLLDIGQKERLDTQTAFKLQQQKLAFGAGLSLLQDKLQGQDISAMSQEQFQDSLTDMTVSQALQIGTLQREDAANASATSLDLMRYKATQAANLSGIQAQGQGLQSLVQAGTQGYNAYATGQQTGQYDDDYQTYVQQTQMAGKGAVPVSYATFQANKDRLTQGTTTASNSTQQAPSGLAGSQEAEA